MTVELLAEASILRERCEKYEKAWKKLREMIGTELAEEEKDGNVTDYACGLHEALGYMDEIDFGWEVEK